MINNDYNAQRKKVAEGEILYKVECYKIQGAIFEVYRVMGSGFLEGFTRSVWKKN